MVMVKLWIPTVVGAMPEERRDIMRERVRELIEKGAKQAQQRASWGSIPTEISAQIEAMLKHELDWKAILRMFIGRTRSLERQSTMKRLNKRLPYMMPGVKRSTIANILCAIDQSGSVSDGAAFSCRDFCCQQGRSS